MKVLDRPVAPTGMRPAWLAPLSRVRREKLLLAAGDLAALFLAFFLGRLGAWWWSNLSLLDTYMIWWHQQGSIRLLVFLGLSMSALLGFWNMGHYSQRKPFWDELRETWRVLLIVAAVDAVLVFLGRWEFSRVWLMTTWAFALLLVPLFRVQIKKALLRRGGWARPTAILGIGQNARDAAAALRSEPLLGYDVVAFLAPPGEQANLSEHVELPDRCIPMLALGESPETVLAYLGNPHLIVALDEGGLPRHQRTLKRLSLVYQDMNIVPTFCGLPTLGMEITHFFSHEVLMLRVRNNLGRRASQIIKRAFDIIGSALLILLLSPVFAYLAFRVRQTGECVIYGHARVGQHGQSFRCYKFRSMVPHADRVLDDLLAADEAARAEWARDFKLKDDPRITPIGAWLRKTSLDELPQLWNVLKGDMSLVGPRPVVTAELERYGEDLAYYLETRPGMTGLWQISGRNDVGYSERVFLDTWYVKNWSLWYDIVILFKTFNVVLGRKGAY
ncbi:undecaprenyl-phosphate galactose phosphotransferase WbaP [Thermithiobacillus plumbiphilus]|uniref:Undecaprenyl-phosphate galactose phosphotransferase WbaP n=1 Tax=Thermithiobacillus plumbiphilus TaxID=1729899 RepID=A0ABU9D8D5_9PROT